MFVVNRSKFVRLFFIIVTVLLSGHAAQTIFSWASYLPYLVGLASLFLVANFKKIKFTNDTWLFFLMTLMIGLTAMAQILAGLSSYVSLFCFVLAAYMIVQLWSFDEMVRCYRQLMTVTTVVALIGYLLLHTTQLLGALPSYINVNDVEYGFSIIFSYIKAVPDRNCAMFWEPGLFATYLIVAIVIELVFVEKIDWKRLALYTVAIVTANSSAGFALWFLCGLLLFVRKTKKGAAGVMQSAFSFLVVIAAVVLIVSFDVILEQTALGQNVYFQKLSTDSIADSSRMAALEHNLGIFWESPIFGAGFLNVASQMARVADTSTSTYLMSVFGWLGAVYTIAWVWGVFKIKNLSLLGKVVLAAIFLIILNKEPHHRMLFTWCMLFYLVLGQTSQCGGQKSLKSESFSE